MSDQSYTFLQSLTVNGHSVDMPRVVSLSYIEQLDLSGASFILQLRDEQSYIRDEFGLAKGAEIVMEMGDVYGTGGELFTETFIVYVCPVESDIITVEGFQKECHELKIKAAEPKFFVNKSPRTILSQLVPSLKIDCASLSAGTYHLNQGQPPTRLLRQMARDYGAACWINRGTIYFKTLAEIASGTPLLSIGLNNVNADVEIAKYNVLNEDALYDRALQRCCSAWTTDGGYLSSEGQEGKPALLLSYPAIPAQLDNQALCINPKLDIVVVGDSRYTPAAVLSLEIIKLSHDAAIDESVAASLVVKTVTHYTESSKYNNRMILGALNEQD